MLKLHKIYEVKVLELYMYRNVWGFNTFCNKPHPNPPLFEKDIGHFVTNPYSAWRSCCVCR
jgi:hypothetical protein